MAGRGGVVFEEEVGGGRGAAEGDDGEEDREGGREGEEYALQG